MSRGWADKKGSKFVPIHKGNKGTGNNGLYKGQTNQTKNKNQHKFKAPDENMTNEQAGINEEK